MEREAQDSGDPGDLRIPEIPEKMTGALEPLIRVPFPVRVIVSKRDWLTLMLISAPGVSPPPMRLSPETVAMTFPSGARRVSSSCRRGARRAEVRSAEKRGSRVSRPYNRPSGRFEGDRHGSSIPRLKGRDCRRVGKQFALGVEEVNDELGQRRLIGNVLPDGLDEASSQGKSEGRAAMRRLRQDGPSRLAPNRDATMRMRRTADREALAIDRDLPRIESRKRAHPSASQTEASIAESDEATLPPDSPTLGGYQAAKSVS